MVTEAEQCTHMVNPKGSVDRPHEALCSAEGHVSLTMDLGLVSCPECLHLMGVSDTDDGTLIHGGPDGGLESRDLIEVRETRIEVRVVLPDGRTIAAEQYVPEDQSSVWNVAAVLQQTQGMVRTGLLSTSVEVTGLDAEHGPITAGD